jgi:monothiol glutaredoxin
MSESIRARIEQLLSADKIVLFMKGTTQTPQCGFSARAVGILQSMEVEFNTVDVLQDPEIRQGIKDYGQWPTIPQLYVDQELVGGSDIITQMSGAGELHALLGVVYVPPVPPTIHATDAFVAEVKRFAAESGEGHLRIQVSPRWEVGIGLSGKDDGDLVVEANGLTILVDADTAKRAEGLRLDFQGGIIVDNPNAPPVVNRIPAAGLKQIMDSGRPFHLFDVRGADEWALAHIEGAILLDAAGQQALEDLPKEAMIILQCHHGIRSMSAANQLLAAGYRNVFNLEGGIDAWSTQVDSAVPRY